MSFCQDVSRHLPRPRRMLPRSQRWVLMKLDAGNNNCLLIRTVSSGTKHWNSLLPCSFSLMLCCCCCCVAAAYNEEPCIGLGGMCQSTSCVGGSLQSFKCPTQPGSVKCCVPDVEPACDGLGGTCRYTSTGCGSGDFVSGKCPDQPWNVKCCVPQQPSIHKDFHHVLNN